MFLSPLTTLPHTTTHHTSRVYQTQVGSCSPPLSPFSLSTTFLPPSLYSSISLLILLLNFVVGQGRRTRREGRKKEEEKKRLDIWLSWCVVDGEWAFLPISFLLPTMRWFRLVVLWFKTLLKDEFWCALHICHMHSPLRALRPPHTHTHAPFPLVSLPQSRYYNLPLCLLLFISCLSWLVYCCPIPLPCPIRMRAELWLPFAALPVLHTPYLPACSVVPLVYPTP